MFGIANDENLDKSTSESTGGHTLMGLGKNRKKKPRKRYSILSLIGVAAVALIVGTILGRFVVPKLFAIDDTKKATPAIVTTKAYDNPTVIFERAKEADKMISVEMPYCVVERMTKKSRFFNLFDIPFSESGYWMKFVGTIEAGVDMSKATMDPVNEGDKTLTIHLPEPETFGNDADLKESGPLEGTEHESVINQLSTADTIAFEAECKAKGKEEAMSQGLIDDAKESTEKNLRSVFYSAYGDKYTVNVVWDGGAAGKEQ